MATKEDALPRFTYDMVMLLDRATPHVVMPRTPEGAQNFADNLPRYIFLAAQRALVDEMKAALEEDENERADEPATNAEPADETDGSLWGLAPVLDGAGEIRIGVPPGGGTLDE